MSKLRVDVEVNSSKVAPGLNASTQAVKKWSGDLKGTITKAFGGAAVGAAISKTLDNIQGMGDSADRMGRTIQEVQLLAQMAQLAGRELGNVELMLNNIAEAQVDAVGGNDAKMATFQAAGFTRESLSQTNELGVLQQFAKSFQGKSIPEMRGMGVSDVVGKKGMGTFATMMNDFANFSETLKTKQADLLDSKTVEDYKTNVDLLSVTFKSIATQFANTFLPLLTFITNRLHDVFLFLEAFIASTTRFFANFMSPESKGKGITGLVEDIDRGESGFKDAWMEAGEKWKARQELQAGVAGKVAAAQEMSELGPGDVPSKDKQKEEVWEKFDVPDKLDLKPRGLQSDPYLSRGGFLGTNMNLLGSISKETNSILKKIEKNTRERNAAMGANAVMEILGTIFGITVK